MSAAVPRQGARILLIDPADRVLLINELDPNGGRPWWLTPGGGIEPGESPQQAAVREVFEETGIRALLAADAPVVHDERRLWSYAGVHYDQHNDFFAVRVVDGLEVRPAALTAAEAEFLLGHRWWSLAELRATDELVFPPDLVEVLERVLADLPPA